MAGDGRGRRFVLIQPAEGLRKIGRQAVVEEIEALLKVANEGY